MKVCDINNKAECLKMKSNLNINNW